MSSTDSRPTVERALDALVGAIYGDDKTTLGNGLSLRNALARIQSTEEQYDLFIGDLDSFKEVNTAHGYDGGDAAIARAGQVLATALEPLVREHGVRAFRQSGDEFAVVAPSSVSDRVAKALQSAFDSFEVSFKKASFELGGSFGRAECPKELTPEDWKARAEMALNHAKASTRVVVPWTSTLGKPAEKLRRRCKSCRASFAVTPTKKGIREEHLHCPQCGLGPASEKSDHTKKKAVKVGR